MLKMLAGKILKIFFVLFLLIISVYAATALDEKIVSYYKMENDSMIDETGLTTPVKVGTPATATGIIDNGLSFDGNNEYYYISSPPTNYTRANNFTINLWINTTTDGNMKFFQHPDGALSGLFAMKYITSNKLAMSIDGGCNTNGGGNESALNDGEFHMLTFTYNNTAIRTYVDGYITANLAGAACTGIDLSQADPITWFVRNESDTFQTEDYLGIADEAMVAFWLNDEEIASLYYNITNGQSYPFEAAPPAPPSDSEVLFINQSPADMNNTDLFTQNLQIVYRFNNTYNDIWLNYTIISGEACVQDINGTCTLANNTYQRQDVNTSLESDATFTNFSFIIDENNVYPYRINLVPSHTATYTNITLTANNQYIADSILDLPAAEFNIYEAPVRTTGIIRIYYYNSSYDFSSNPATSPYTTEIYNNLSLDGYNHAHYYSGHNPIPYKVNASGFVNDVYFHGGGFLIRGNPAGVIVTRDTRTTRANATYYTANSGAAWAAQTYTLASHVHTFNYGDYISYQGFMNDSSNNIYNDSPQTDTYEITPYPPTSPNIISPINNEVINQYVNVNYTGSTPNTYGANITNYTIDIYNDSLVKVTTITDNGVNLNYTFNAYLYEIPKGYYYIYVTALDNYGATSVDFERFYLNYSTPNLDVDTLTFTAGNGLNVSPATTLNYSCTNSIGANFTMLTTFNGAVVYSGIADNATNYDANTSTLVFGYNNLTINCSDFLGSIQETYSVMVYTQELCLIDEQDNTLFNPLNLTRTRVYFDDNSSYFDYKLYNVSCINYTSIDQNKLRFDLGYIGGTTITRYIDMTLVSTPVRVCANKEGVTYYEQLIISVALTPVVMKSVYANCLIAADYTRFAYQDAYLLKAYSTETLYYLYKFSSGVQTFLASIDGSIETYINIDNLEFRQNAVDVNILTDAITFSQYDENITQIYYKNLRGDNVAASINITRLDTSTLVYSNTDFLDPNEITILFDYSTLTGVNTSTIFRIDGFFTSKDGTTHSIKQYFDTNGNAGFLSSGIAFAISFLMMIFGLTFASVRITFSWLGLIVCIASIAIAAVAVNTWYLTLLIVVEVIASLYIVITMTMQHGKTISGVA